MKQPLASADAAGADNRDWKPVKVTQLDESAKVSDWGSHQVANWLASIGMADYIPAFQAHRITGDILEVLDEAHLRELGVNMIGHRVLLSREVAGFRRIAMNRQRFRVIWREDEVLYAAGPLDWCMQKFCFCTPCCVEPDTTS